MYDRVSHQSILRKKVFQHAQENTLVFFCVAMVTRVSVTIMTPTLKAWKNFETNPDTNPFSKRRKGDDASTSSDNERPNPPTANDGNQVIDVDLPTSEQETESYAKKSRNNFYKEKALRNEERKKELDEQIVKRKDDKAFTTILQIEQEKLEKETFNTAPPNWIIENNQEGTSFRIALIPKDMEPGELRDLLKGIGMKIEDEIQIANEYGYGYCRLIDYDENRRLYNENKYFGDMEEANENRKFTLVVKPKALNVEWIQELIVQKVQQKPIEVHEVEGKEKLLFLSWDSHSIVKSLVKMTLNYSKFAAEKQNIPEKDCWEHNRPVYVNRSESYENIMQYPYVLKMNNLSVEAKVSDIKTAINNSFRYTDIQIATNQRTGASYGWGLIAFPTPDDGKTAWRTILTVRGITVQWRKCDHQQESAANLRRALNKRQSDE